MRIVMLEPLAVSEAEFMEKAAPLVDAGHEVVFCGGKLSEEEKIERAKDADVLVIANSPLSGEVIRAAKNLKMISVGFTGIDHVDVEACRERNILICNAQGYCTDAVAELTFGLIFDCLRNVLPCDARVREGKTKDGLVGNELRGKTIGIVGTGAIGCRVAEIAKVFHCNLLGYNRSEKEEAKALGIQYVSLEELAEKSDIITLHVPGGAATKNLINRDIINRMNKSAILVNVARGSVVDSEALAEALNEERIAGAGIDVFEMEPPVPVDHPLSHAKNVVLTPHVAFATKESMLRRVEIVLNNISAWMHDTPENVCNY